jgi:tRNA(fMet)-specific endonuclease VapC
MFLLDTDTVIYILENHPTVIADLDLRRMDPMGVAMELFYGTNKSQSVSANLSKVKRLVSSLEMFSVEGACIEVFAMLKAELETAGNRLDDFDLLIGACALSNGLTPSSP